MKPAILFSFLLIPCLSTGCGDGSLFSDKDSKRVQNIRETGELYTADTKSFILKRYGRYWSWMTITGMVEHGTRVEAGDSVIQMDPSGVKQFIVERKTQLENQKAALQKTRVNNDIKEKGYVASLKSEEAAFNLAKLQLEASRFETEKAQKIKQLQFQQAQIKYEKVKRNIEYSRIIARNEEKIQQIRMQQVKDLLEMAEAVLPELTIRTPISGVFQVGRRRGRKAQEYKIGDEIRAGNSMGSVPDMTWMKVRTYINEVDRPKVEEGQHVIVRMDALPAVEFEAVVEKIGVLCHTYSDNDDRKVFNVDVKILVSDERLKPGMTVSCEFISIDVS